MSGDVVEMLVITQSAGELRSGLTAQRVRADFRIDLERPSREMLIAKASVTVCDAETGDEQYTGSSTCQARFGADGPGEPRHFVPLVWPHLRADLVAQCARLAHQYLSLPVEFPGEALEQLVSEATPGA